MSRVILVVPSRLAQRDDLVAAAHHLGDLIGGSRVIEMALPLQADATAGQFAAEVALRGGRADFLVAAQPHAGDSKLTQLAFQAALFRTERPILMLPPERHGVLFGRRVAIAWRDDARTIKALMSALPLLSSADEIHLLAGARAAKPTPAIPPVLLEHGLRPTLHVLAIGAGSFGEQLLVSASHLDVDMLVAGAAAHTRLHDMLLGGVTNYLIEHAKLPVLLRN